MTLQSVLDKVRSYGVDFNPELIIRVFEFAQKAHEGQKLRSGDPYVEHLLGVVEILTDLKVDSITICAALLHDVPQRTSITLEEIEHLFGSEIALILEDVTNLSKIRYRMGLQEHQVDLLRKIAISMTHDLRAMVIKLASRLQLMKTLQYVTPEHQERIAKETLEIYAPLSDVLGIWRLRWQLEDICFQYLQHDDFQQVQSKFDSLKKTRNKFIEKITKAAQREARKNNIACDIHGRFKHFFSIFKKMNDKRKEFNEIYDVFALRTIVATVPECYQMLGIIHAIFPPVPGRIKDYIASPKTNGYRSIHTTVYGPENNPTEFQIRTQEMHEEALYGVAAHWYYKRTHHKANTSTDWVKDIFKIRRQWHKQDANPFDNKLEVLQDRIFVFTPQGDVVELPIDSTSVDFAYGVHTTLGHCCRGAIVNNKETALHTPLKTGDTVYIIQDEYEAPQVEWLSFVKANSSRHAIQTWLKNNQEEPDVRKGRLALEVQTLRYLGKPASELQRVWQEKYPECTSPDDFYRLIAQNRLQPLQILQHCFTEQEILQSQFKRMSLPLTDDTPPTLILAIRIRHDETAIHRIFKILTDLSINLLYVSKRLEHTINRIIVSLRFSTRGTSEVFALCNSLDQIASIEQITKQ